MQGAQQLTKTKDGKITIVNNKDNDGTRFNVDAEFDKNKVMDIIKVRGFENKIFFSSEIDIFFFFCFFDFMVYAGWDIA